jgi:hypothetical protein
MCSHFSGFEKLSAGMDDFPKVQVSQRNKILFNNGGFRKHAIQCREILISQNFAQFLLNQNFARFREILAQFRKVQNLNFATIARNDIWLATLPFIPV